MKIKRKLVQICLLCAVVLLLSPAVVQAQSGSGDGFVYSINASNANTITITQYTGPSGAVTIPTNINGLTVTTIGYGCIFPIGCDYVFTGNNVTSVTIPANVINIKKDAFAYCANLTSVYFQGNAPSADSTVFTNDSNATIYYLPGTTGWSNLFAGRPAAQWSGLTITDQPQSQTILTTSNVTFTVTAITISGATPISYQWYFNNTNLQTDAKAVAQMLDGFVYGAIVTNGGSGYTLVPQVQFVGGGGSGASGTSTVSNGMVAAITLTNAGSGYTSLPTVVIAPPNGLLIGQTNASLNLNAITTSNTGNYFVIVSNSYGNITSSIATLTIAYPPSITQQPSNQSVVSGSTASFNVTAAGTQPLSYQSWMVGSQQTNAIAIPVVIDGFVLAATITGGGAGYLTVPIVQIVGGSGSGAGGYAVVSNQMVTAITMTNAGSDYSTPPTIQIAPPTAISLTGQTSSNLALLAVNSANAGNYYVVVTNNYGSVTSAMAGLVVGMPPQNFTGISTNNNQLKLQLSGTPNFPYILQSATNLTSPINWQPI